MSSVKVGINGFGRIGRTVLRAIMDTDMQVVAINDKEMNVETMLYLLKYDSIHGHYPDQVKIEADQLVVEDQKITIFNAKKPESINWDSVGAEYIVEATGLFNRQEEAAKHFTNGARRVLVAGPSPDAKMIVYGVNHNHLRSDDIIISAATDTTNATALLAKIVNDKYEIAGGMVSTVHAVTADQPVLDSPAHKHILREGREVMNNIIPASTGAAKCLGRVIPALKEKIICTAYRVPVDCVSLIDFTVQIVKGVDMDEV